MECIHDVLKRHCRKDCGVVAHRSHQNKGIKMIEHYHKCWNCNITFPHCEIVQLEEEDELESEEHCTDDKHYEYLCEDCLSAGVKPQWLIDIEKIEGISITLTYD